MIPYLESVTFYSKTNEFTVINNEWLKKVIPFSRFLTFFEERVILILWICSWGSSSPGFVGFIAAYAILKEL